MDSIGMIYDDLAWEKAEELFEIWKKKLYSGDVGHDVAMLAKKYRQGIAVQLHDPVRGSYNVCLRVEFLDKGSAMIRFAVGGQIMFPEEKLRAEVAAMRFIAHHTTIPIPFVFHMGTTDESTGGLGPFIVMEYVEHHHDLGDALNKPGRPRSERPLLDPDISEETLELVYGHMAHVLLQLSLPSMPLIGSLSETREFEWTVTERPMTYIFNELVQLGDVSPDRLPEHTYQSASEYYSMMADMQLEHLSAQHNDAIDSAEDCRYKYVARQLFRNLAADGRLDIFPEFERGPFKLFCEDQRPTHFLAAESHNIIGVVDWEFTFSAPAGFAFSPPWWLLLERPERWRWGLDHWEKEFTLRLKTWLKVLKAQEQAALGRGILQNDQVLLSDRMQRSWDTGAFWINYVVQNCWAFDKIYFGRLDKKFFGKVDKDWLTERLPLLTEAQRQDMEPFVQKKLAQKADRRLVDARFDAFL